jgi:hypothetical protein
MQPLVMAVAGRFRICAPPNQEPIFASVGVLEGCREK